MTLAAYLAAALAYAVITPTWQAADEPAHYNYIRHLVIEGSLPVLQMGDFPSRYLDQLKAAGFPEGSDVSAIRYESHQPPLYYLLAAPVLTAFAGDPVPLQVRALRLFTVTNGVAALAMAYSLGLALWPRRQGRAAALAATVAFIPMHTAMSAGINNDVLAEALTASVTLLTLRALVHSPAPAPKRLTILGILLGLCLLTKTTAYIAVPLVLAGLLLHRRLHRPPWARVLRSGARVALPAAILWLPWVARNLVTYGLRDPLGLTRHDAIAASQLTTAELLAEFSPVRVLTEGTTLTFKSFWGVFGWMGVPMHEPVYLLLAVVSATAVLGLVIAGAPHLLRQLAGSGGGPGVRRRAHVILLAAWGSFSICGLLWYNMKFVQYQGRYLYAALPVWSAAMVVGMVTARERPLAACAGLGLLGAALFALGWARGDVPGLLLALLAAAAAGLFVWRWALRRWPAVSALPLLALWALDLAGALYYVSRFL